MWLVLPNIKIDEHDKLLEQLVIEWFSLTFLPILENYEEFDKNNFGV